ncbi:hypothetical protein JoomaDRAFT_1569 [Galbibacter orientalis DSM 19592]|uniref:Addiction module component n=1 Tax=Galbibacter orientalis DSM 19592 TaxID=926559 RepID=I3C4N8_9FLAO|nr:hypothetical protein [Galbibacter orientalis]EIJ38581.1 hypothetical protein JoomaDRAFT_1569 [Galbibacter orientalis DSM 19592]
MATTSNLTVEQLAQALKELSNKEKIKLLNLLPEGWFDKKEHEFTKQQKANLDKALAKEDKGESRFHSWSEIESYVRNPDNV